METVLYVVGGVVILVALLAVAVYVGVQLGALLVLMKMFDGR